MYPNPVCMNRFMLFLFVLCSIQTFCQAQQGLLITHKESGKEILIKEGDYVKFRYHGYIGQPETIMGVVSEIEDSLVAITSIKNNNTGQTAVRWVYVNDINGFRKFRRSRPYLVLVSNVITAAGTIVLYAVVDRHTNWGFGEKLGFSVATGLATRLLLNGLFPERIKNHVGPNQAWRIQVLK
jgi:hypothetical protein